MPRLPAPQAMRTIRRPFHKSTKVAMAQAVHTCQSRICHSPSHIALIAMNRISAAVAAMARSVASSRIADGEAEVGQRMLDPRFVGLLPIEADQHLFMGE